MKPDFSETSYSFSLVHELINQNQINHFPAPYFPTLAEEANVGYDVELDMCGVPFFLQFKRSDVMTRSSAREIAHFKIPFQPNYYRFNITRRDKSKQHELLIKLKNTGNYVFYAAPRFHTIKEFNDAYHKQEIINRSVFVDPSAIGLLPDNKDHTVCFKQQGNIGYFCSEPRKLKSDITGQGFLDRLTSVTDKSRTIRKIANTLLPEIENLIRDFSPKSPFLDDSILTRDAPPHDRLNRIAVLARQHFGCIFLIFHSD